MGLREHAGSQPLVTDNPSTWRLLLPILLAGCAAACSPAIHIRAPHPITAAMLLRGEPLAAAGTSIAPPPEQSVLELSEAMRSFVHQWVRPEGSDYTRLHTLLRALLEQGRFNLEYEDRTLTAAETFAAKRGNCLSFTNMFVALAREAGLDARFQEVDVPPNWTRDGDVLLVSRHINVNVNVGFVGEHVVDFNMADFHAAYKRHTVSDARGVAQFYNNLGAEQLGHGDYAAGFAYFRKAIETDPALASAWSNLAALYLHAGYLDWADAAWQQALALDPRDLAVLSNAALLYERQGRDAEAKALRRDIARYRMSNPYYRYFLAQQYFDAGNYGAAISHLMFAIHQQPNDDSFYGLLGLSYLRQEDRDSARRWIAKAAEVSVDEPHKRAYNQKLEMLMRSASGS